LLEGLQLKFLFPGPSGCFFALGEFPVPEMPKTLMNAHRPCPLGTKKLKWKDSSCKTTAEGIYQCWSCIDFGTYQLVLVLGTLKNSNDPGLGIGYSFKTFHASLVAILDPRLNFGW